MTYKTKCKQNKIKPKSADILFKGPLTAGITSLHYSCLCSNRMDFIAVVSPHAGQEKKYEVKKRRVLNGKTVPHYAAVEPKGKGLMVASEKPFAFTHVDGLPVQLPDPEPMEVEKTGVSPGLPG